MKRFLCFVTATLLTISVVAQVRSHLNSPNWGVKAAQTMIQGDGAVIGQQDPNPMVSTKATLEDPILMWSVYDLQSNSAVENRLYYYPSNAMGGIATMAHLDNFTDRGTGYNFFDGSTWGPQPSARIETVRTGWPSYAPFGAEGEIVVAHQSGTTPLIISTRPTKGSGSWTQTELYPPAGASGMLWPRMVTNGTDNTHIHIICLTSPTGNGGVVWNNLNGALVYNRSLDGGTTWDGWQLLDGMTSSEYLGFAADSYSWAEPLGETLCFTTGDNWLDQFIMKSTDNGDTWTKSMIWPCPFPMWAGGDTTGAFFCPDGTCSVALDNTGKAHVVFGLQRASGDEAGGKYWYPFTDGVVYWNENMPALPEMMNWDSLYANGNLIGWVTDSMVWYAASTELAYYYNSMTAYPNIIADASGDLYAVWAGVTDLRDINNYMLRHLFGTASLDNGENWSEDIQHLTDDFLYTWSECVFPFVAKNSTDYLYLIMQEDGEAGLQFYGAQGAQGQAAITQNNMIVMTIDKSRFWPIAVEETHGSSFQVSPPYPNPVKDLTAMTLILENPGDVSVHVYSLIGQHVQNLNKGRLQAGPHELLVDASGMKAGVYFISVKVGDQVQTRKMIVE